MLGKSGKSVRIGTAFLCLEGTLLHFKLNERNCSLPTSFPKFKYSFSIYTISIMAFLVVFFLLFSIPQIFPIDNITPVAVSLYRSMAECGNASFVSSSPAIFIAKKNEDEQIENVAG